MSSFVRKLLEMPENKEFSSELATGRTTILIEVKFVPNIGFDWRKCCAK